MFVHKWKPWLLAHDEIEMYVGLRSGFTMVLYDCSSSLQIYNASKYMTIPGTPITRNASLVNLSQINLSYKQVYYTSKSTFPFLL